MEYILSIIGLPSLSLKRAFAPFGAFADHLYDHLIPHSRNNYHPHILGHRALALMSGLLVAVKVFTVTALVFGPVAPAFSSAITAENIISLTNQSRQAYNMAALTENSELDKAAQTKADDMLAKGYFSHDTPDGHTPWDFIVNAGYNYLMAGENLAVNFTEAENVETAWMNSPGHRANILNNNFEEIGIGISQGEYQGHTAIFVVQMFGTPAGQKITLTDQSTPVQTAAVPAPTPAAVLANNPASQPVVNAANPPTLNQPQTLGVIKQAPVPQAVAPPAPAAPAPMPVAVTSGNVELSGDTVNITAQVSGPVSKAIAYFGQEAVMLSPKSNTVWTGQVSLNSLAQDSASVRIRIYGMQNQTAQLQLADFSPGTVQNYNLSEVAPAKQITFLGLTFNPNSAENRFYLIFMAALLSSLILAIAVKRHVQHLSLIANSSFVIILAAFLMWAG